MSRSFTVTRYQAPSYYEHAGRLQADHAVIYGPHFDLNGDAQALLDPFRVARRFAHAIAQETGEPYAWGWYEHPEGLRPAVCAAALVPPRLFRVDGATNATPACARVAV